MAGLLPIGPRRHVYANCNFCIVRNERCEPLNFQGFPRAHLGGVFVWASLTPPATFPVRVRGKELSQQIATANSYSAIARVSRNRPTVADIARIMCERSH